MTDSVLRVEQLIKRFERKTVLQGIDAEVRRGEVIGLLGLNGAGKTTLLETALGYALPDSGQIQLFGQHGAHELPEAIKQRIGFVPQSDELLDQMTGNGYLDLIRSFYPQWDDALVERLIIDWALPMDLRISKLSVGQRQKLSLLTALAYRPELLVLDEPVASLDPLARRQFLQEIVALAGDGQRTVLFSTHIVSDLERIAERVWILKEGRLLVDAPIDVLKEQTVRVHLRSDLDSSALAHLPAPAWRRRNGSGETLLFTAWHADYSASLAGYGAAVHVETLGLEDIFLELHA